MVPQSLQQEERVCRHSTERLLKFCVKALTLHVKAQQK